MIKYKVFIHERLLPEFLAGYHVPFYSYNFNGLCQEMEIESPSNDCLIFDYDGTAVICRKDIEYLGATPKYWSERD